MHISEFLVCNLSSMEKSYILCYLTNLKLAGNQSKSLGSHSLEAHQSSMAALLESYQEKKMWHAVMSFIFLHSDGVLALRSVLQESLMA